VLFFRDERSAANIWISSNQNSSSALPPTDGIPNLVDDPVSSVEWLDFRLTFDRAQDKGDIETLAKGFSNFAEVHHSSLKLRQVELRRKSPHPRRQKNKFRHVAEMLLTNVRQRLRGSTNPVGDALEESIMYRTRQFLKNESLDSPVEVVPRISHHDADAHLKVVNSKFPLSPNTTIHSEEESDDTKGCKRKLDDSDQSPNLDVKRRKAAGSKR
jgi:hypothetical protein